MPMRYIEEEQIHLLGKMLLHSSDHLTTRERELFDHVGPGVRVCGGALLRREVHRVLPDRAPIAGVRFNPDWAVLVGRGADVAEPTRPTPRTVSRR